jgi:mono/diheme cytochrome c family protein
MKKMLISLVVILFVAPTIAMADGRADYRAKCAACHGATKGSYPKLARVLKVPPLKLALGASKMNRDEMIAIVEKGKDKMPGYEKELTREQIAAILDYAVALNRQ